MNFKVLLTLVILISSLIYSSNIQSQQVFRYTEIDSLLVKNANAVLRFENIQVDLNSSTSLIVKTKRVVTVLNKLGNSYANSFERYSPTVKITKLNATVLNAAGSEIKVFKKRDFLDRSAFDGFSLALDDRIKYFKYTPVAYPYTLIFESEVEYKSTLFSPPWRPISASHLSLEKSVFTFTNNGNLAIRSKEKNLSNYSVSKSKKGASLSFEITNIPAIQPEIFSPSISEMLPYVKIVPENFSLEGISGTANDWKTFGKWMYDNLILGKDQLPEKTIKEIGKLTEGAGNNKEKARIIYKYVQDKTRYASIQLGIGGWMPFSAEEVDRLGYGDCKALTNYTKALLESQDIISYYTVVYGNDRIQNIDKSFASLQGNHVILNIPDEEENIWLECTSQTTPFNFIAGFTDDRNVLRITPEGGEIVHTKTYHPDENGLLTYGKVKLKEDGSIEGMVKMKSTGTQFNDRYLLKSKPLKDQEIHYKDYWDYMNGLHVKSILHQQDKEKAIFTENINVSSNGYAKKAGSRLLINPNVFNRYTKQLPKYKNRKMSLEIARGYLDLDECIIDIPENFVVQSIPESFTIETEFGNYSWELEQLTKTQLNFKRELRIKSGLYPKEKYEAYRQFMIAIAKADARKIMCKQS